MSIQNTDLNSNLIFTSRLQESITFFFLHSTLRQKNNTFIFKNSFKF